MKNSYKGFVIYLLVVLFGVFACNDAIVESIIDDQNSLETSLYKDGGKIIRNAKEAGKVTLTGIIPKDKLNDTIIYVEGDGTKLPACDYRQVSYWAFRYYMPKAGKSLGIFPVNATKNSESKIRTLNDTWGFSYYFHANAWNPTEHQRAIDAGFERGKIMIGISNQNYATKINDYKPAYAYYMDEPLHSSEYDYEVSDFANARTKINLLDPNALFVTADYGPSSCLDDYVQYTDKVYCSTYKVWQVWPWPFSCFYQPKWPYDYDQRPMWNNLINAYGTKSSAQWINVKKDIGEFNTLLGYPLVDMFWLYQLEDDGESPYTQHSHLSSFCLNAWQTGYLRRFSQKVTEIWECFEDCEFCGNYEDAWRLTNVVYGSVREDLLP